ncbi:MAG: rhodanese-like domain-containing protein, partial [Acidobacteriota bacterium]
AEHVPLQSLVTTPFPPDATLVLISDGGAHAAQAWVFLRALGHANVYFLRGGQEEWLDDVMNPAIAPSASPEEKAVFARTAALSRYFGGVPRILEATERENVRAHNRGPRTGPAAAVSIRRRGC